MLTHGEINVLPTVEATMDTALYIPTLPYFSTYAHVSTVIHVTLTIPQT